MAAWGNWGKGDEPVEVANAPFSIYNLQTGVNTLYINALRL